MSVFTTKKNKVENFAQVCKGKTKKEIRIAEEHLLMPENLPKHTGEAPKHRSELHSRTALIVFKNKYQKDLIGELLSIRTSVNNHTYITDISLLESLAMGVREGKYVVDGHDLRMKGAPPVSEEIVQPKEQFVPLSKEERKALPKKARKKYKKIYKKLDIAALEIFKAIYMPTKNTTEPDPKKITEPKRGRRSLK